MLQDERPQFGRTDRLKTGNSGYRDPLQWSSDSFLEYARDWLPVLLHSNNIEVVRQFIIDQINRKHFATYSECDGMHDLDRVVVRDCARVWRGLLHPRSERLVGFSVLQTLIDVANGVARPDISPAFWAEICHLVQGIEGSVCFHEKGSPAPAADLAGREAAVARSAGLDVLGASVDTAMARIRGGLDKDAVAERTSRARFVMKALGGGARNWSDWHWHLRHVAKTAEDLGQLAELSCSEFQRLVDARNRGIPVGVTPYYASLFDDKPEAGIDRAIRVQVIPPRSYIDAFDPGVTSCGASDFMLEADTSPLDLITRRYPSIAIIKPYNSCPQICVYCQRNWEINEPLQEGSLASKQALDAAIAWLRDHPAIHEVLVTGGDPLVMADSRLKIILDQIASIPHIQRIRIGSRTLVTLPMRITSELCRLLQTYRVPGRREICVVTHVQHPGEVTPDFVGAVSRLRRSAIPVYNQLVYTFHVSRRFEAAKLRSLLRLCGVDPYYTFYPKGKDETIDYRVPIARLLQEQKEESRLLPGMARTDEIVYNVPGLGKSHLNSWQQRDLISVRPDGARVYEFHPWEKQIAPQKTYVGADVPLLDYLKRLHAIGENPEDYESIWYYF